MQDLRDHLPCPLARRESLDARLDSGINQCLLGNGAGILMGHDERQHRVDPRESRGKLLLVVVLDRGPRRAGDGIVPAVLWDRVSQCWPPRVCCFREGGVLALRVRRTISCFLVARSTSTISRAISRKDVSLRAHGRVPWAGIVGLGE